jgi:uncharacterized protein (DUF362 family)/Pyruvate/2-oxoacid:ferredoxin oxidoreductase delta subunit
MDKVSVINCGGYDIDKLDSIIEQHFKTLEAGTPIIHEGNNVLIKPNLIMRRRPDEATTTHPEFIAAIVRAVKRRGGIAIIADSPGGPYNKQLLKSIYAGTGMEEIALRESALLNYDVGTTPVKTNGGQVCSSFDIINPIVNADVVISAAKLKTHGQMIFSGAVKNLFGALPGLIKPEFHYRYPDKAVFGNMLVDLCELIKPEISFIDGIVGMEGNGPTGGSPKNLGVTLAGLNPHALDLYACSLIGFEPKDIPTLTAAIERGLCPGEVKELEILGDSEINHSKFKEPDSISLIFGENLPAFIREPLNRLFTPRPAIIKNTCIGCGKCAESCPQHTITMKSNKAVIEYTKCIKCYCCHEMCPKRAIKIKRFKLFGK